MPYSTLTVSALAVLAVQLLLCHRVRSLFLRLLPAAAFSLILALCAAAYLIAGGAGRAGVHRPWPVFRADAGRLRPWLGRPGPLAQAAARTARVPRPGEPRPRRKGLRRHSRRVHGIVPAPTSEHKIPPVFSGGIFSERTRLPRRSPIYPRPGLPKAITTSQRGRQLSCTAHVRARTASGRSLAAASQSTPSFSAGLLPESAPTPVREPPPGAAWREPPPDAVRCLQTQSPENTLPFDAG